MKNNTLRLKLFQNKSLRCFLSFQTPCGIPVGAETCHPSPPCPPPASTLAPTDVPRTEKIEIFNLRFLVGASRVTFSGCGRSALGRIAQGPCRALSESPAPQPPRPSGCLLPGGLQAQRFGGTSRDTGGFPLCFQRGRWLRAHVGDPGGPREIFTPHTCVTLGRPQLPHL